MRRLTGMLAGLLVPAFLLTGAIVHPALAQEQAKAKTLAVERKMLAENDKVQATELIYKPGSELPMGERPFFVMRVLKGGTLMRTYPDGKTETVQLKEGQVLLREPGTYSAKNVGKTTVHLYNVVLKK
jgi:mannose-6-phosphate isomerase-like protein (cupin superfamily)